MIRRFEKENKSFTAQVSCAICAWSVFQAIVMANASGPTEGVDELEKPPASHVWEHFGFPVKYIDGKRVVDKTTSLSTVWHEEAL